MKTVIVPSNGNAAFIDRCNVILDVFPGEQVNYIFLDIRPVPDDSNELIPITRTRRHYGAFDKDFCAAVRAFELKNSKRTATTDFVYGSSSAVFKNFVQYKNADLVIFDQDQWVGHPHFRQRDIFRMVMRSGCEVMYISAGFDCVEKAASQAQVSANRYIMTKPVAEMAAAAAVTEHGYQLKKAPATVTAQYRSVDQMLNELESRFVIDQVLSCRFTSLAKYFLRQSTLDRMVAESTRPVLWVRS